MIAIFYKSLKIRKFHCVILLVVLLLLSCSSGIKVDRQLDKVEEIMAVDGSGAWEILTNINTEDMSENQEYRMCLLVAFHNVIYANPFFLTDADMQECDSKFSGAFNPDEIKWLIVKSYDAKLKGDPLARLENLKDAEFLAIQLDRKPELAFIYLYLANVYEQGFNGTVSRYYADKAAALFRELNYPLHLRDARMATVGAYAAQRDYKSMLDSLESMQTDVMEISTESYKTYFLDQLARAYAENGKTDKAVAIWHRIYDGQDISSNTLAHWAYAYMDVNKLDSALVLIMEANHLTHNATDEYLCRNVEYQILEKMGRKERLTVIDSLRQAAADKIWEERKLEESSLALNVKYDSATREAWSEANRAKFHTFVAIFVAVTFILIAVIILLLFRKRNCMLRLEHENDVLRIQSLQNNLFESDSRNKKMNSRISELFQSRFKLLDGLAATYFECRDTGQEQKRIYADVRDALNNFSSPEAMQELTDILNGYHDNIVDRFKADFPKLSASQTRLALYLFCGFSLPSISIFTGTELRNLYVYKSRLKSAISKSNSPGKAEYLGYFE